MKPAPFKYVIARTLHEALAAKAEYGDEARFLAGGQSLVPTMNFRMATPAVLIDLNPVSELSGIKTNGVTRIGAMTRYRMLEADAGIAEHLPIVHEALPHIAHPQIRNRGTLGGNLSHADPASEMPAIMLALNAALVLRSAAATREVAARDFFLGALETAIGPDEMLTDIVVARLPANTGSCFMEVARRKGDFAIAGIAAVVTRGGDGTCTRARLTYCGVAQTPFHAEAAGQSLIGAPVTPAAIKQAAVLAMGALDPPGNSHGDPSYQRHIAGVLTRRALATAWARTENRI
jgi:CO/xanthine dehydrogenase FAD-binding subunit